MASDPATIGISFSEMMSGGFALGETDPFDGQVKGDAAGTRLVLHATITIADLDRFIADPQHVGAIAGSIDYAPLGGHVPGDGGVFNLFSPTEDPQTKYMVYELALAGAEPYYLAGHKLVRNDPGFGFWHDTTTLFTKLHRGKDATGPVVGAGTLSLSLNDLWKLSKTMHVSGAESAADKAAALAKFGRFFLGEMWDTYILGSFGGRP